MNSLVQGIEPQFMGWEFRVLTSTPQVVMCRDLSFDDKIKIILQKIDITNLAPSERPKIKPIGQYDEALVCTLYSDP